MEYLGRRTTSMAKEGCFESSKKGSLQCKRNSAVSKGKNVVTNSLRWQEYKSATERDGAPRVDVRSLTTFHLPPWMPRDILKKWPTWLSRWFGYRPPDAAPPATTNYVVWIWSFIGAFGGLSVLQAIFTYSEYFLQRKVPSIIASYVSISRHLVSSPYAYLLSGGCFRSACLRSSRITASSTTSTSRRPFHCVVDWHMHNKAFCSVARTEIR